MLKKQKLMLISILTILSMISGFVIVPNTTLAVSNTLPAAVDGVITLTEDVTLTSEYVVPAGTTLKIDLSGYTLTTDASLKKDTIYVEKGASLTITGNGTITNNAKGYAALFNNGTVTIDGATLKRDTTGGNDWYVICNHGNMTIENANVSVNGTSSSLVENGYYDYSASSNERNGYVAGVNEQNPKLTINGGVFDGGMNTIKNDDNAILLINGGIYQNNYQVAVMNWNDATINDGTFKTPTGNDKTNLFVGSYGADSVDKGILVINGGTFEAEYVLEGYKGITTPVEINGGTFNYTEGFINEDASHSTLINDGVEIVGEVTAPVSALKYAKSGAVITVNSAVNVGDELDVPEGVNVILTNTDSDKEVVKNEDGTYTVEYKAADYSKVDELIKKAEALNKEDYKDFSAVENAINAVVRGKNITEQATVDGYAEAIENAINSLEKKQVTVLDENIINNEEEDITPPATGDNAIIYAILFVVAVSALVGIRFYVKKKSIK